MNATTFTLKQGAVAVAGAVSSVGATATGRLLAQTAITLDTSTVTQPAP